MATYNNKNYGNRKVYVANTNAGAVRGGGYNVPKKPKFVVMKKKKTSAAPKILIAIEVLFIILCALSPVFIGRKDRANKNVDIETAYFLGKSLEKGLSTDDTLNEFVQKGAQIIRSNDPEGKDLSTRYRIIGYMEADNNTPTYYYVSQTVGMSRLDTIGNMGMRSKLRDWGQENDLSMKFHKGIYMNQWIIAVDRDGKVHIFAGGGATLETLYISQSHNLKGAQGNRVYEVYPSVDLSYRLLLSDTINGWKY